MARPKKEDLGKARERIIEAFWNILAETPYSQISIRFLSDRAKVNHNTFYKYFYNIDNLAEVAFEENLIPSMPALLIELINKGNAPKLTIFDESENWKRVQRALLFAQNDSAYLHSIIQKALKQIWLSYLNVEESELSDLENFKLNFIFGGFISVLQNLENIPTPETINNLYQEELFGSILRTLSDIGERHKTN